MKKATALLCALWILLLSSNANIHVHYCCGKIADISLFEKKDSCPKCKKRSNANTCQIVKKSCCKEISKIVKAENTHKDNLLVQILKPLLALPLTYDTAVTHTHVGNENSLRTLANAPPQYHKQPYYILHRSLII